MLYRYEQGMKWQTINGDYSAAIQKFYIHVLKQEWDVHHIPRPRRERSLPGVGSVKREGATVRTIIEILGVMLQQEPYRCPYCQSDQLEKGEVLPDRTYSSGWLGSRAPPLHPLAVEPGFRELELNEA